MAIDQITFLFAKKEHFDQLEKINQSSSQTPFQTFALKNAINNQTCLMALNNQGEILGWCAIHKGFELLDILYITTHCDFKRQGVSKRIFEYLLNEHKECEIILEVRKSNQIAINLYESLGMICIDTRKNYYREPKEDALVYKLFKRDF